MEAFGPSSVIMQVCQPQTSHGLLRNYYKDNKSLCVSCFYNFRNRLMYKHLIVHCHINFHSCGGVRQSTLLPYLLLSLCSIPQRRLQSTSKIYG